MLFRSAPADAHQTFHSLVLAVAVRATALSRCQSSQTSTVCCSRSWRRRAVRALVLVRSSARWVIGFVSIDGLATGTGIPARRMRLLSVLNLKGADARNLAVRPPSNLRATALPGTSPQGCEQSTLCFAVGRLSKPAVRAELPRQIGGSERAFKQLPAPRLLNDAG